MRVLPASSSFLRIVVLALVVAALTSCSLFQRGNKNDPAETLDVAQLYSRGVTMIEGGNFPAAVRIYRRLIARFPFGPYTEQAQLNLAYAQYKDDKPDEAYSTINRFIKTYPTHKHIDYAYYLRGLINFNRAGGLFERYAGMDMTRRSQVTVRQSFDDFNSLISRYPQSRYAPDARQRMIFLRNQMAQAELNIGLYYFKRDAYVASANRAKSLIETYPGSPQVADALALMTLSYRKLGQTQLADDAERVLKLNYPQHPYFAGHWPSYPSSLWKLVPFYNRGR
ncbi:outer membrane protein assembly factor BamD [Dokdonella sp.]|uniref:outer membrane protein assembly factor BamD n=1 Tax=Dokdonella sp. TaxID=2291710 RepID=UPI0031C390CC|nr:outer membrane protein assembly factor BamD [Dokdonella sp.]